MYTYPTTFAYIKTQRRKVLANSWHFQVGRQNLPCVLFYDLMHVFSHPTTYLPTVRIFIWGTRILRVFYSKISSIHSHTLQYIYPHYNISGNQCTRTRCLANCGHFHVGRQNLPFVLSHDFMHIYSPILQLIYLPCNTCLRQNTRTRGFGKQLAISHRPSEYSIYSFILPHDLIHIFSHPTTYIPTLQHLYSASQYIRTRSLKQLAFSYRVSEYSVCSIAFNT